MKPGLVVSDIDGTLVTPDKQLTPAALAAVADLAAAGIPFTVVSSRPPRGMARVVEALSLGLPFAAFNGANIVGPDFRVIEAHRLSVDAATAALAVLARHGVGAWAFADDAWLLRDLAGPNVERERHTVGFEPTLVADFVAVIGRIDKIVAVSNDPATLDLAEAALRADLGARANVERSQAYYIDITHPHGDKGHAVRALAARIGADLAHTVVIGDMTNDVAMFRVAGFSIAMGQGPEAVRAAADAVTAANTEDGFAQAMRRLVLPRFQGAGAG